MIRPIIALALCAPAAAHAQSTAGAAASPTASAVVVPFDPPLDTPIRLRIDRTRERTSTGAPPQRATASSEEEIVFTAKTAQGYTLKWRSLGATAATPEATEIVGKMSAGLRRTPVMVRLDTTGKPIEITNWPAVNAELRSVAVELKSDIPNALRRIPEARRGQARAALEASADSLAAYSREQTFEQLLRDVTPLLGWGGTRLAPGSAVTAPARVRAEVLGLDIPATRTTRLTRVVPGRTIELSTVATPDAAAVGAAIDAAIARALPGVPEAERPAVRSQMTEAKSLRVEDRTELTLDSADGAPRAARFTRVTTIPGTGTQTDTSVVTRR